MQDPRSTWTAPEPRSESLRLTRALAQDLRASLHGLRMALEMMAGVLPAGAPEIADRALGLARAEAAQIDRTIEQLGLWIRLLGGDYRVHLQRVDLRALLAERLDGWAELPDGPVHVRTDRNLIVPVLDGLRDFLKAYALPREHAGVRLSSAGEMTLFGPPTLLPVLQTVVDNLVPDLQAAKGPAIWLIGPSLAVSACRCCDGQVRLEQAPGQCSLWMTWQQA